jgi:endoglucanase
LTDLTPQTAAAAHHFLSRYVTEDGRVLRHDQGRDVVSEGQAYGMLIAAFAHRPAVLRTIWSWTRGHLGRADGLLAYHATAGGRIVGEESATDADVLAAYVLLSYAGRHDAELYADGRQLAAAILNHEAMPLPDGVPLLVAGRWATTTLPPTVNPSYLMPCVLRRIGRITGDDRWLQSASASATLLWRLTQQGRSLPPDWAHLVDGELLPVPGPPDSAGIRYGLDAARLPLWLAAGSSELERRLAASWWTHLLSVGERSTALALTASGKLLDTRTNPLPLLAGAAAAQAAGDQASSAELRIAAALQGSRTPTYFGDAWLALGGALLDGSLRPDEPDVSFDPPRFG